MGLIGRHARNMICENCGFSSKDKTEFYGDECVWCYREREKQEEEEMYDDQWDLESIYDDKWSDPWPDRYDEEDE